MKKVVSSFFLFLSILSFGVLNVKADNIDGSRTSSLSVTYQYDTVMLSNVDVSLYYLASVDATGVFQFTDDYLDVAFDTTNISSSDLTLQAEMIENYISSHQLQASSLLKTNQNGVTNFSDLVPGLYLVTVDSKVVGDYRYDASPTIVSIPILEDGTYQYDVQMNIKTEREELEQEITPPGGMDNNNEMVPNTLDNIYLYIVLLVISIIVIIGVIMYISKRKDEKNEKKK